ncbi:type II toxin-antitoxin system HicB family antitoxin [Salinibacterium sp. PAMC 21357]|uniref:type II toxin-antitoxin system HicB family antitoxin n=1 Tax=Salinibacterium sp. PAMC 21357 TaxID=1112215 RepID=UPI000289F869|nr:toxin-antitoxin system HicB family antitoxin [Salinibacterium sp. PAMC 21357]
MNTSSAEHYTYRVRWSPEDEAFVGTVAEMPSLSWLDHLSDGAFAGIRNLAKSVLEDMLETGETPPRAIADRTYSGKFMVRVTPESHRRLVIEAAEQNVSLNRLAASRLVS